jgi:hypothetical protein
VTLRGIGVTAIDTASIPPSNSKADRADGEEPAPIRPASGWFVLVARSVNLRVRAKSSA